MKAGRETSEWMECLGSGVVKRTDEKRRRVQRRVTAGKAQKKAVEVNISNRGSDQTGCPSNRR